MLDDVERLDSLIEVTAASEAAALERAPELGAAVGDQSRRLLTHR